MNKFCDLNINDGKVYFKLTNCDNDEFLKIIDYKSWVLKKYRVVKQRNYFVFIYKDRENEKIVSCNIGFGPLLVRYLESLGYLINGKEFFRSKKILLGKPYYKEWDFQSDANDAWFNNGGCGVIKAPTGSGKSIVACNIMYKLGLKTIICVHTGDLLINVWYNNLIEQFGEVIKDRIGIIGGGLTKKQRMQMRILKNTDFDSNISKDIVIATTQSLISNLNRLNKEKFGLMIYDECLPYDTEVNTTFGNIKIGKLYDMYLEGRVSEIKNMKVDVLNTDNMNINESNFIPKKTMIKDMYNIKIETGISYILSYDHKCLSNVNDNIEYVDTCIVKNIGMSLMRNYKYDIDCIWGRIYGYMLGDGHLTKKDHAQMYGDYDDMIRVRNDLKHLGVTNVSFRHYYGGSDCVTTVNYGNLDIKGSVTTLDIHDGFGRIIRMRGYPSGNKTNILYEIPKWIMNGSLDVKREFLAGYMGAELNVTDSRLKRSFTVPRISYYKRKDLVNDSKIFLNQLIKLYNDLNVKISNVNVREGNIRKDGTVSYNIVITFSNSNESLLNLLDIGCRYCKEREVKSEIIRQYMLYSNIIQEKTKKTYDYVLKLYNKGYSRSKIISIVNSLCDDNNTNIFDFDDFNDKKDDYVLNEKNYIYITKGIIDDWLSSRSNSCERRSLNNVMEFNEWLKKVNGDMIFLDIINRKYECTEQGYDLTVDNKFHNYFIGDCPVNVHNCHHSPAEQFKKTVGNICAPYKLGLSGTLVRPDGASPMIYGLIGNVVYNISIDELVRKGFLVKPVFKTIVINDDNIQKQITESGLNTLKLGMYVNQMSAESIIKKNYILNLLSGLHMNNKRFLLYTDYVTPKNNIFTRDYYVQELNNNGIRSIGVSSEMSTSEREVVFNMLKKGEVDGLVFGKLGAEGVNIPEVDSVVMCNATRSTITFPQRVGRAMRKTNDSKKYAFIYEVILNTPLELSRIEDNFYEYKISGFKKEIIYIN